MTINKGKYMELKKVTGSEPAKFEKLRGGTFINVLPTRVVLEDNIEIYEYYQMFTFEINTDRLQKLADAMVVQVCNKYLADTDWIWNKKSREVDSQQTMTIEEFNIKYAEVIAEQKKCINIINKLGAI